MKNARLDLHIRFNPLNRRHQQIAAYMEPVKTKYLTALVVAAIEEYQRQHPYGVDYRELDKIRKESYCSFKPKKPIQKNLTKKTSSEQLLPSANAEHQLVIPKQAADVMDQLIDLYDLDEDE